MADEIKASIDAAAAHGFLFYVYTLADADGVFYVGKGKGRRLFHHEQLQDGDTNHVKKARICAAGEHFKREILAFFCDESAAYALERELIAEWRVDLTNIQGGMIAPDEARLARMQALKDGILPFDAWCQKASDWQRMGAIGAFGSMDAAYLFLMEMIDHLMANPVPTRVFIPRPVGYREVAYGIEE